MKLVRSCQHSSFCFSVSHSCALTDFPSYSTGCFFKGKHHIQNLSGSSLLAQSSTCSAVSRILQSRSNSFGQGLGNRASRVVCHRCHARCWIHLHVLLAGRHCGGRHGVGQVLLWTGAASLGQTEALEWNMRCAEQKWEETYLFQPLMEAHVFYLSINTFFNCFIRMENKEGTESLRRTGQGSGCASVKLDTSVRQEEELTFVWSVGK